MCTDERPIELLCVHTMCVCVEIVLRLCVPYVYNVSLARERCATFSGHLNVYTLASLVFVLS